MKWDENRRMYVCPSWKMKRKVKVGESEEEED